MKEVAIRGFLLDPAQSTAPSSPASATTDGWVVVRVKLPDDISALDCNWLMTAANEEFSKVGVQMRLVGLLSPVDEDSEETKDSLSPPSWMIDPNTRLDTMDLMIEFEAVFICEKLCVKTTSGKPTKVTASDFEFIRLLGEGAAGKVFQVRRRKSDKMYAVCCIVQIYYIYGRSR